MKSILTLLRQFLLPFNGWPWLFYLGLALLPVVIAMGFWYPKVAFALAVWDYVILLALPFALTPKVLRALICNRRLLLVPGFAPRAVLTAFMFTLVQSGFLCIFAWLNHIDSSYLRNAVTLFIVSSVYVAIMQYAVTTAWAMVALSLSPATGIATVVVLTQDNVRWLVSDSHLAWILATTLLGWLLAVLRTSKRHQFKPEHQSLENYKTIGYQRTLMAPWLVHGSSAVAAPDATMLLGYPATLATRLRVLLYLVFLGPAIGTIFLSIMIRISPDFYAKWSWHPSTLDIFLCTSLFPTTFAAFQNVEWVSRLRLLWLRQDSLRSRLWQILENQLVIYVSLLMLVCGLLTVGGLLFSQLPATVLLHYPVLILVFNVFYSYYMVCSRTSAWPSYLGLLVSIVGSCCIFAGLWVAIAWHDTSLLYGLEALVIVGGYKFRMMARQRLQTVDWLVVKPLYARNAI